MTRDLPLHPVALDLNWSHLIDISLADPDFGNPSKVDLLLGADVFCRDHDVGWRTGPPGSPVALETKFGWVLAGSVESNTSVNHIVTYHVSALTGDDILRKFWEIKEQPLSQPALSLEERIVVQHFELNTLELALDVSLSHFPESQMPSHLVSPVPRQYGIFCHLNVPFMPRGSSMK